MALYALGELEPRIDPSAFIHPDAVIIGDVTIGPESTVWPSAVLRGDSGPIVVGARTSIQDGAVIHTTPEDHTIVGNGCVIGHLVHLEGCVIEDGSLVGSNATVLARAVVRSRALVGAAALVPQGMEVPSGAMALGVPAKLRLDSVDYETQIADGVRTYAARGPVYRAGLRRLD